MDALAHERIVSPAAGLLPAKNGLLAFAPRREAIYR
jgi:hypothetical protein